MMTKNEVNHGEAADASMEKTLAVKLFLTENYLFRCNKLNGKTEFCEKPAEGQPPAYRTLTERALNSIVQRAKLEKVCKKGSPRSEIVEYVNSEEVPEYDPIGDYLDGLPEWDRQNHVGMLLNRLPGLTTEKTGFMMVWLRSMAAHWRQMDKLHGNECVPLLIGPQGCGKTTFFTRLLPEPLREYFMDHLDLSNQFSKNMALTNNLLVNLDEFDAIRPSQHPALKQTLSKSKVNSRPIFGTSQEDRPRYASFVATTNNPHPLTDVTGSRRYICITIPQGMYIDNTGDINYDQLYAQILYELRELKAPFWFNNAEVARIQELNQGYMEKKDIAAIVNVCFRKPMEGEKVKGMNCSQMIGIMKQEYATVKDDHSTKVQVGLAMKDLGYEFTTHSNVNYYKVVPLKTA